MGYKVVCLDCRRSFSQGTDFTEFRESFCFKCGQKMVFFNHSFRPPKKSDDEKWETVKFLAENGFFYQHIYEKIEIKNNKIISYQNYVQYPENMREAKEFVEKYKSQAKNE